MANIIENKKIRKIVHRFDTAENWKKSNVQLLPGEIAFDDEGNFKVGLNQEDNSWRNLPFAGKSKFVSGTLDEIPSILDGKTYGVGDMFKDTTTNKWYFLTGYDGYGEYIWDELTFGSYDLDSAVKGFEAKLAEKADKVVVENLQTEISNKIDKDNLKDLATKEELNDVDKKTEDVIDSVTELTLTIKDLDKSIEDLSSRVDDAASKKDLHDYVETLSDMIEGKADKSLLDEKADLSTVEDNFVRREAFDSVFEDTEQLKELIANLFDENGIIRSTRLPGSVDDIIEGYMYNGYFSPLEKDVEINVGGKLYLDVNTKTLYRWSGSQYVEISSGDGSSLILGTTSGTAYEGSAGKALEVALNNLQGTVIEQGGSLTAAQKLLDSVYDDVISHNKDIADIKGKVNNITKIEDSVDKIKEDILDINTTIKSIKTNSDTVPTLKKSVDELKKGLDTISTTVDIQENIISSLEGLPASMEAVNKRIDVIESLLQDSPESIDDVIKRVDVIEATLEDLPASVEAVNKRIDMVESTLEDLPASVEAISTRIDKVESTLEDLPDINTALAEQKEELLNKLNTVEKSLISANTTQNNRLNSAETLLREHIADIASLKTSTKYHKEQLDKLEEKLDNITIPEANLSTIIDENGFIKSSLLPGYVDDVIEGRITESGFEPTDSNAEINVGGKLYVDIETKAVYRWSGTQYVKVSSDTSLILGTTSGTAYEGSAGKLLDERVTVLENKTTEVENSVTTINSAITTLQNTTTSLETRIEPLETISNEFNEVKNEFASVNNEFNELKTEFNTTQTKVDEFNTYLTGHDERLNDLAENVENVLSLKLPDDNTIQFGSLAFQNTINSDDIVSLDASKLYLNEGDELELWGGDSSD